jgi:hypothetical protein
MAGLCCRNDVCIHNGLELMDACDCVLRRGCDSRFPKWRNMLDEDGARGVRIDRRPETRAKRELKVRCDAK